MNLPDSAKALVAKFAAAFPLPSGNPTDPGWDDMIRSWTVKLGCQAAFTLGPQWGLKRASSTRPIGKDSLALVNPDPGHTLYSWDLLIGAGTGKPALASEPTFYDLTGTEQVFEPAPPHDYLGTGAPSTGQTPGTPAPPSMSATDFANALAPIVDQALSMLQDDIKAECDRIYSQNERIYADLVARLNQIQTTRAAVPSTPIGIPQIGLPTSVGIPTDAQQNAPPITPEVAQTVASIVAGVVRILHR